MLVGEKKSTTLSVLIAIAHLRNSDVLKISSNFQIEQAVVCCKIKSQACF